METYTVKDTDFNPDITTIYRTFAQREISREERRAWRGSAPEEFEKNIWPKVESIYQAFIDPRNKAYIKWREELDKSLGFPNDYYLDPDYGTPEDLRLRAFRSGLFNTFLGEYRTRRDHPELFLTKDKQGNVLMDDTVDLSSPEVIVKMIQTYTAEFTAILQYCYQLGKLEDVWIRPEHALEIAKLCYHNSRADIKHLYEEYIKKPAEAGKRDIPVYAWVRILMGNSIHPEERLDEVRDFVDNFDPEIMPEDKFDRSGIDKISTALRTAAALFYSPYKEGYKEKRAVFIMNAMIRGSRIKHLGEKMGYPVENLDPNTWQLLGIFSQGHGLSLLEKFFKEDEGYGDVNYLLSEGEKVFTAPNTETYGNNPEIERMFEALLLGGLVIDAEGTLYYKDPELAIDRLDDTNPRVADAIRKYGFAATQNYYYIAPEFFARIREQSGKPLEDGDLHSNEILSVIIGIENKLAKMGLKGNPSLMDRITKFITAMANASSDGTKVNVQTVKTSGLYTKLKELESKYNRK